MLLGGYLTLLIGPTIPIPAPEFISRTIESVSVTQSVEGRDGFQITFKAGRDSFSGAVGYLPLLTKTLKVGHRVVIMVTLNARPHVLIDGLVTKLDLTPSLEAGGGKLTLSGTELTVLMDIREKQLEWPAMAKQQIVQTILVQYIDKFPVSQVFPIPGDVPDSPTRMVRQQSGTDFALVSEFARDAGYAFGLEYGSLPGLPKIYFGPLIRPGAPKKALTFKMGAATNVTSIQFSEDGDAAEATGGLVQEGNSGAPVPVVSIPAPAPFAVLPSYANSVNLMRIRTGNNDHSGDVAQAIAAATSHLFATNAKSVKGSGELDVLSYGEPLPAGSMVGVRGVGLTFDGLWRCTVANHTISRDGYKQSFELQRGGTISNTPVVPV